VCLCNSSCKIRIFIFDTASRPNLVAKEPRNQCVPGAVTPGVKQSWHEADHSPPPSAEVKNA
jgi:hypothetical protein